MVLSADSVIGTAILVSSADHVIQVSPSFFALSFPSKSLKVTGATQLLTMLTYLQSNITTTLHTILATVHSVLQLYTHFFNGARRLATLQSVLATFHSLLKTLNSVLTKFALAGSVAIILAKLNLVVSTLQRLFTSITLSVATRPLKVLSSLHLTDLLSMEHTHFIKDAHGVNSNILHGKSSDGLVVFDYCLGDDVQRMHTQLIKDAQRHNSARADRKRCDDVLALHYEAQ